MIEIARPPIRFARRRIEAVLLSFLAGAALLATPTHASDCYAIKDPDLKNHCLATTKHEPSYCYRTGHRTRRTPVSPKRGLNSRTATASRIPIAATTASVQRSTSIRTVTGSRTPMSVMRVSVK